MKNRVVIWRYGIDDILDGTDKVSGIPLQLSIWARTFLSEDWSVYCQTLRGKSYANHGISFINLWYPSIVKRFHLSLFWEALLIFFLVVRLRPQLWIERGPERTTFTHSVICRLLGVKFVFFGASDVNFVPGKDLIGKSEKDTRLYRRAIRHINYFITQNQFQSQMLFDNYGKTSYIIPNLWISEGATAKGKKYDVIWVSNLRPLKRAEWIINLAKNMPQYKFAIVGGVANKDYFENIKRETLLVDNLDFLGPRPVDEVNTLISQSNVLTCTSEYEGFPNTFIQAWSYGKPVVTTVDPSNVVSENNLGAVATNIIDFGDVLKDILDDETKYGYYHKSVIEYFGRHHSAEKAYYKLIQYINE